MEKIINAFYWYCTDFCIHMANLLTITYVEFNFWLFIVLFPLTFSLLLCLNLYRYFFYPMFRKVKKRSKEVEE